MLFIEVFFDCFEEFDLLFVVCVVEVCECGYVLCYFVCFS